MPPAETEKKYKKMIETARYELGQARIKLRQAERLVTKLQADYEVLNANYEDAISLIQYEESTERTQEVE